MNNRSKNITHAFLALFFTTVFFSTFLVRPAHILFFHHDLTKRVPIQSDQSSLSNPAEANCPICNFEFCFFITDKQSELEKVPVIFAEQETARTFDCLARLTSHHFQLRAPPVF